MPSEPLESSEPLDLVEPVVTLPPTNNILRRVLKLAQEIRGINNWIGYSAFLFLSIMDSLRPYAWEGETRIDLVANYATAFTDKCNKQPHIEVVACCLVSQDAGVPEYVPVSDTHPLSQCKHYLAATAAPLDGATGAGIQGYYNQLGMVVMGTAVDGNCGIDVMCQMKGLPANIDNFKQLRIELCDFIISNASEPWVHDLMVATGELTQDELDSFRASQTRVAESSAEGMDKQNPQDVAMHANKFAVAELMHITEDHLKAVSWKTGMTEDVSVRRLARALPEAVLEELLMSWKNAERSVAEPSPEQEKILVNQKLFHSRMHLAKAFDDYLVMNGWDKQDKRKPRNSVPSFIESRVVVSTIKSKKEFSRSLLRWHKQWQKDARQRVTGPKGQRLTVIRKKPLQSKSVHFHRRQRNNIVGRPCKCPWLRVALYEWWTSLRYSIDWEAVQQSFTKRLKYEPQRRKAMTRYSRALVKQKAMQLQQDYCVASLTQGLKPRSVVNITSHWLKNWEADYGLSMRKANRKYKVPKYVMEERCEITWLNISRVRAFIMISQGYDPECENFDQSPFYGNEQGSLDSKTLAVAGGLVPLIENHSDTRSRWTANLTTFSNKERLDADGPPYAEFAFKGKGELELRLRKYVEGRGFGKWLTVRTTDSASYKEPDILDFLATHLPDMSGTRQWRIIIADDYSAHHSQKIFNLCWSRGYVLILLGGGITPVIQTCDTDLNQAVKREYTLKESEVFVQQMQDGFSVPSCTPECCIEMMADVLMNMPLHYAAAEGYIKTGLTVALDGSEDHKIVREASVFFRERGMRRKINLAVNHVRREYDAGRLPWSKKMCCA